MPDLDRYQRKPDVTLAMNGETWIKLNLSRATPEELIKKGEIKVKGNATEAARQLNLFGRYKSEKAVVIPATFCGRAR